MGVTTLQSSSYVYVAIVVAFGKWVRGLCIIVSVVVIYHILDNKCTPFVFNIIVKDYAQQFKHTL